MVSFGKTISDARKRARLSQKNLAAQIQKDDGKSISPQYLNDIERDRRNPPPRYILDQLARILDISADHLYYLADQWPPDLREEAYEPESLDRAFQAFRRELKDPRRG